MPYSAYQLINTTIVTASAMVRWTPVALSTIAGVSLREQDRIHLAGDEWRKLVPRRAVSRTINPL
jgi:hypothetical protein